jgi:hypothetical protein
MTISDASFAGAQRRVSFGPWLWGARVDLPLFAGSAAFALGLVLLGELQGLGERPFPGWAWLVFVLGIDVAHVYATLFRTYLDREELARHPARYALAPLAVFVAGYYLYAESSTLFWRCFAYVAVYHFVRQQVGWVALYRAKNPMRQPIDRFIDDGVIYAATLYPILHWHAYLDQKQFAWFVEGDFVAGAIARAWLPWFEVCWWVALAAYALRQLSLVVVRRSFELGKTCVVGATVAIWYVGIVATNNDFAFTVTNVVAHGVPYLALLWAYARERAGETKRAFLGDVVKKGLAAFLIFLVCLAFVEEFLWDRLVFHDRPWLFGAANFELPAGLVALIVPVLMVPQATHYVLDGLLWRRKDTRELPAQRRALGFTAARLAPTTEGNTP